MHPSCFCDSSVMKGKNTETRKRYCESILDTASAQSRHAGGLRPVMATNFCISKKGLKHRLGLILSKRTKKKYFAVCFTAVALTVVSGSLIAFAESEKAEQAQPTPNNAQVIAVSSPQAPKHTEATYAQTTRKTSEQPTETTVTYAQTTRKQRSLVTVISLAFRSPVPVSMSVVSLKVFNQNPSDYLNRSQRDFLYIIFVFPISPSMA